MASAVILSFAAAVALAIFVTSSAETDEGIKTKTVCSGDNVTLNLNLTGGEGHLTTKELYFQENNGSDPILIGTYINAADVFLPSGDIVEASYTNDDFTLSNVSTKGSGIYSAKATYTHNVTQDSIILHVQDPPTVVKDTLVVNMSNKAAYNSSADEWHVQLTCGKFLRMGDPPVTVDSVLWRTPENDDLPSSSEKNGTFVLNLPNPIAHGNYNCYVNSTGSACPQGQIPSSGSMQITGDEADLLLLRSRLDYEHERNNRLEDLVKNLTRRIEQLAHTGVTVRTTPPTTEPETAIATTPADTTPSSTQPTTSA